MKGRLFFALLALSIAMTQVSAQQKINWKAVDDAMSRPGQDQPDGAHKYSMPRSDLKVTVDGVPIKAGFVLRWQKQQWRLPVRHTTSGKDQRCRNACSYFHGSRYGN